MNISEFKTQAHLLVDWMADYLENVGDNPVKPQIKPGEIKNQLPSVPPEHGESFTAIFEDFKSIIMPGITHWQHPQFFAYFPSGGSEPSILAEMLSATLATQCMIWMTSPAAEELEEQMMQWLQQAIGLPSNFTGVIQDSSSSATLVSLICARESKSNFGINKSGMSQSPVYRIYSSSHAHSSVEKGVKIAGFGSDNLVTIPTDKSFAMDASLLEKAIKKDIANNYVPLSVISTIGTTSSTAVDPIESIGKLALKYGCWHHIDASYSGTALILPEMRWMSKGVELCDSFVFNPHKWMFTNFDCSAYFVKDKTKLINTFSILPEYLKTPEDKLVNNYRDWGIPLGRRFRALKLWFVLRTYGIKGLQEKIRDHIKFAQWFKEKVETTPGFELMSPVSVNLICFRIHPLGVNDETELEVINSRLLQKLNGSGKILLTQTRLNEHYVLRFVSGQIHSKLENIITGWQLILSASQEFLSR